eukprot:2884036-Prymnesium_polylepis.1
MEREYRAFRHSRLAKPTLIFAIIGTIGYAPWWFIMVLPIYRCARPARSKQNGRADGTALRPPWRRTHSHHVRAPASQRGAIGTNQR